MGPAFRHFREVGQMCIRDREIDITEAMETAGAYHYAYDMDVVHEDCLLYTSRCV